MSKQINENDIMLKTSDACKVTGFSRGAILSMQKNGTFPEPDWVNPDNGYKYWWRSTLYKHFGNKQALTN